MCIRDSTHTVQRYNPNHSTEVSSDNKSCPAICITVGLLFQLIPPSCKRLWAVSVSRLTVSNRQLTYAPDILSVSMLIYLFLGWKTFFSVWLLYYPHSALVLYAMGTYFHRSSYIMLAHLFNLTNGHKFLTVFTNEWVHKYKYICVSK